MELKRYQKQVIADLSRYLDIMRETQNYKYAFQAFWQEKSAPALGLYQDLMPGVPNLCFKVPTGGGKTFLACNAIRPIFDALPPTKTKVVVWLVPSDAILSQTVKALKNPRHAYREKINVDFSNRVEVYTKEELLNGQNFNPTTVTEQLSIMVLSYDSFRGRGKEGLKAYKENSNLAAFAKVLGAPEQKIDNADDTALFQVINQLSPLVIVDESHHARSTLSLEMLNNFNPCFVLDLTATPKKESNIISYVDAIQLKRESMVKLPVIVYNRNNQGEVLADTIDLRCKLEELAIAEEQRTGRYIRPIALFQAQPRGKEDSTTFEKLREKLVDAGIPADQIAIRTADVNELKHEDLMSPSCPIRYIITVNALKEGWDCPFAYILSSLANKTSQVDVEQILGRILRQPHTVQHKQSALNMSYVLTSSSHFNDTVERIVKGLNNAGFTAKDYRLAAPEEPAAPAPEVEQLTIPEPADKPDEEFLDFDPSTLSEELERRQAAEQETDAGTPSKADTMLQEGAKAYEDHNQQMKEAESDPFMEGNSWEVRDNVNTFWVKPEFEEEIQKLKIPQFFLTIPNTLFTEGMEELLEKEQLAEGFTLKGKAYDIDFGSADDEIAKVDVQQGEGGLPKACKMSSTDQQYFKQYFNSLPPEKRVKQCKDIMFSQLNKMNMVEAGELMDYLDRIVDDMGSSLLDALEKSPMGFALKIKKKIEELLSEHYRITFRHWLETDRIICKPSFVLPQAIHPAISTEMYSGSLYQAEDGNLTTPEQKMVMNLTGLDNILWWHRNISQKGFCINGFLNHYPDFIVMTKSGKIIMVETKGEQLKNDDSREKIEIGKTWQYAAGSQYRYYMVFENDNNLPKDAVSMSQFLEIVKDL